MHIFEVHLLDGQVEEGASFAPKEQSGMHPSACTLLDLLLCGLFVWSFGGFLLS